MQAQRQRQQIQIKALKIFYLFDDYSNSVSEKVFICDNSILNSIRHQLPSAFKICGLLGPFEQINNHLLQFYKKKIINRENDNRQTVINYRFKQHSFNVKQFCQTQDLQKPSVYLLKFQQKVKKSQQSTNKSQPLIFLALSAPSKFFLEKPYDQKSLIYLLLRYIGDLCSDILVLYSPQILSSFSQTQCPFSSRNTRIHILNAYKPSSQNIQISELPFAVNMDQSDKDKVDWKNSVFKSNTNFLQYWSKIDKEVIKKSENSIKGGRLQELWKQMVQEQKFQISWDVQKNTKNDSYNQSLNQFQNIHFEIKQQVQKLGISCIKTLQQILTTQQNCKPSKQIEQAITKNFQQIYYWTILNHNFSPLLEHNKISQQSNRTTQFLQNKMFDIMLSLYHENQNQIQQITKQVQVKIREGILHVWGIFQMVLLNQVIPKFRKACKYFLEIGTEISFMTKKIQVMKFNFQRQYKDGQVSRIQLKKQNGLVFHLDSFKKYLKVEQFDEIQQIKAFRGRFLKQNKLVVISKMPNQNKFFQYYFLSISGNETKSLAKIQDKQLVFAFDETSREVFILKTYQRILITFYLDDFQEYREQRKYTLNQSKSNFQIISYSYSRIPNKKFYFIDSRRDCLYCYDMTEMKQRVILDQNQRFNSLDGKKYEQVRAFNHNMCVALANQLVVKIFLIQLNDTLKPIRTIQTNQNSIFLGMSSHTDQTNQYLIIYKREQFKILTLQNMNCQATLLQKQKKVMQGNPILDILYQAKEKFGNYRTYTVCQNTPKQKQMHLYHIVSTAEHKKKIQNYLSLFQLEKHIHHFHPHLSSNSVVSPLQLESSWIYQKVKIVYSLNDFLNESQSRIPVQLCSLQNGNIIPLKDGNMKNMFQGLQAPIQKRCNELSFGSVERMLKQDKDKKTVVVSIMGEQSTGKSYLMNRVFGTRFTVASCRTTIGIWISLVRTEKVNFLLLDCQGLFSPHRDKNQEQKLILILTSISDFTILNLNKNMTNQSLITLMSNLSKSVSKNDVNLKKSNQLYNGQLIIIVRNVVANQTVGIIDQLRSNYNKKREIRQFFSTLFNTKAQKYEQFMLITFPSYTEVKQFQEETNNLRQTFIQKSLQKKQTKSSETILQWLKIILNQLACDDNKLPLDIMINRVIQMLEIRIPLVWTKGIQRPDNMLQKVDLNVLKNLVESIGQSQQSPIKSINKLLQALKQKPLQPNKLNSVTLRDNYQKLNSTLVQFMNKRYQCVQNLAKQKLNSLDNKYEKQQIKKIQQKIRSKLKSVEQEKQTFQFCLESCSFNCEQVCIKIKDHGAILEKRIGKLEKQIKQKSAELQSNQLTQSEIQIKNAGVDLLQTKCKQTLKILKKQISQFEEIHQLRKQYEDIQKQIKMKQKSTADAKKFLQGNIYFKHEIIVSVENLKNIILFILDSLQKDELKNTIPIKRQIIEQQKQKIKTILQNLSTTDQNQNQNQSQKLNQNKNINGQVKTKQLNFNQFISIYESCMAIKMQNTELVKKIQTDFQDRQKQFLVSRKNCQKMVNQIKKIKKDINQLKENVEEREKKVQQLKNRSQVIQQEISKLEHLKEQMEVEIRDKDHQLENLDQSQKSLRIQVSNNREQISKKEAQLENNFYNLKSLEDYIIPKFNSLYENKKEKLFRLYHQYLILLQQFKSIAASYKIKYDEKSKGKVNHYIQQNKKNPFQQQQQKYCIKKLALARQQLQNQITNHQKQVQQFITAFPNDNESQFKYQKQLIKQLCCLQLPNQIQINKKCQQIQPQYFGFFSQFYSYDLSSQWDRINQIMTKEELIALEKQKIGQKQFIQLITEKNKNRSAAQLIEQKQLQKQQIEEKIREYQQNQEYQKTGELIQMKDEIQKFIETLKKCVSYCKNNFLLYFNKMIKIRAQANRNLEQSNKIMKHILQKFVQQLKTDNKQVAIKISQDNYLQIKGQLSDTYPQLEQKIMRYYQQFQSELRKLEHSEENQLFDKENIQQLINFYPDNSYCQNLNFISKMIQKNLFSQVQQRYKFLKQSIDLWIKTLQSNQDQNQNQNQDQNKNRNQKQSPQNFIKMIIKLMLGQKMYKTEQKIKKITDKLRQQLQDFKKIYNSSMQRLFQITSNVKKQKITIKDLEINKKQNLDQIGKLEDLRGQILKIPELEQENRVKIIQINNKIQTLKQQQLNHQTTKNQYQKLANQIDIIKKKRSFFEQLSKLLEQCKKKDKIKNQFIKYHEQRKANQQKSLQIIVIKLEIENQQKIGRNLIERIQQKDKQNQKMQQLEVRKGVKTEENNLNKYRNFREKVKNICNIQEELKKMRQNFEVMHMIDAKNCSCMTNHKCDMQCEYENCKGKKCFKRSGHRDKHACDSHPCDSKCQININCQNKCRRELGHKNSEKHDCLISHSCQQKCKYCNKKCQKSRFQIHQDHNCYKQKCPKSCILCGNSCSSLSHSHDNQTEIVIIYRQNATTNKNQELQVKLHLCDSEHLCPSLCSHPGVCANTYQDRTKIWNKNGNNVTYDYVEQIQIKKKCSKTIPAGQYKHEQSCQCDFSHSCKQRCPDCRSLCYLKFNHPKQKQHQTNHRNQESLVYASQKQNDIINVKDNNNQLIFRVGDVSEPFKCNQSCQRKGRGHFHLIQCPGGDDCYQNKYQKKAMHSNLIYEPFRQKKYDMVLCSQYWKIFNFEMPCRDSQSIKLCNFACHLTEDHKNKSLNYCTKQAWHTFDNDRKSHSFECDDNITHKKLYINDIQICFLIDGTGSFGYYKKQSIQTLKKIIQKPTFNMASQKTTTNFAVVIYRDHKMSQSKIFQNIKQLCISKKQKLRKQPDTEFRATLMTQVVFQDTLLNLQVKFNSIRAQKDYQQKLSDSQKFIINYHYPFYFDVQSSRRFLDEERRPHTMKYKISRIMPQATGQKTLKKLLEQQLDYYIRLMANQQRQQKQNQATHKLVQVKPFTNPQNCIQFLQAIEAVGGGDPPQAVIDGMYQAANLKWLQGQNTRKYILHLFDSPPHGKIFGENTEDYFPDGCPCNKSLQQVVQKINSKKINYVVYPFNKCVNATLNVWNRVGLKLQVKQIGKLQTFSDSASKFICLRIQQNQILVRR